MVLGKKINNMLFIIMICLSFGAALNPLNAAEVTAVLDPLPISIKQKLLTGQFKSAAKELKPLAANGHALAQYQMAILYLNGKGIKKSVSQAEKLLTKSAKSSSDSAFLLGSLYQKGRQLKSNPQAAIKYLKIANSLGNNKASKLLQQLNKNKQNKKRIQPGVQSAFEQAIKEGKLAKVLDNYKLGVDLDYPDNEDNSPLLLAVKHRRSDIVQWLLKHPIKLQKKDNNGNSAMHIAAQSNQLKILISLTDQIKNIEPLNNNKQTPLMLAIINGHKSSAQWLLSKKVDANRKDRFGNSAKYYSKKASLGLIFDFKSKQSESEKKRISKQQQNHQMQALVAQSTNNKSLYFNWPVLHIAISQKQTLLVEKLLKQGNNPWHVNPVNDTAFAIAITTAQFELTEKMFELQPVNLQRNRQSINDIYLLAIHKNNVTLVKRLFSYVKTTGSFSDRNYALIEAVKTNSSKVVDYLLAQTVRKPDAELLHLAIKSNYKEVAATLLLHDASVNWKDAEGRNALWIAADNSNHDLMSLFILYKSEIDVIDIHGQTALMRASLNVCVPCVQVLIQNNANPEIASKTGNTSIMFAAQKSDQILKLMLENDVDLSVRNKLTLTPLMLAVKSSNLLSVRTLLDAGANPRRRNEQGQNAYELAINKPDILKLLEDY